MAEETRRLTVHVVVHTPNAQGTHVSKLSARTSVLMDCDEVFADILPRVCAAHPTLSSELGVRSVSSAQLTGAPSKWRDEIPLNAPLSTYLPEMEDGSVLTYTVWLKAGTLHADGRTDASLLGASATGDRVACRKAEAKRLRALQKAATKKGAQTGDERGRCLVKLT